MRWRIRRRRKRKRRRKNKEDKGRERRKKPNYYTGGEEGDEIESFVIVFIPALAIMDLSDQELLVALD